MIYTLYEFLLWIAYMAGCISVVYNGFDVIEGLVTKTDVPMRSVLNAIASGVMVVLTTYIHSKYY